MKSITEIAEEYERNLEPMRRRRDELKALAKAEPCAELRIRLWQRVGMLEGMIYSSADAIARMREYTDAG